MAFVDAPARRWILAVVWAPVGCSAGSDGGRATEDAGLDASDASTGDVRQSDAGGGATEAGASDVSVMTSDVGDTSPVQDSSVDSVESGGGGPGSACQSEGDCASGLDCSYDYVAGCSAKGSCVPKAAPPYNGALTPACACDGVTVSLGSNFNGAPAPIDHIGPCAPDAGPPPDAGNCQLWGGGCDTNADCCQGLQCVDSIPTELFGYCVP